jgi:hypothetical protein
MHLSRRSFVRHAATASLLAVNAGEDRGLLATELDRLNHRRAQLQEQLDQLDRQWRMAHQRLPEWCRPGPKYSDATGNTYGPRVGWPGAEVEAIRLTGGGYLIRPSPSDLRALFYANVAERSRELAAKQYQIRSTQLIRRLRARRAAQRAVCLPGGEAWQVIEIELESIDARIDQLTHESISLLGRDLTG